MIAKSIVPAPGYIITAKSVLKRKSSSTGIVYDENEDDFLVTASVIAHNTTLLDLKKKDQVVFSVLNAESFRDDKDTFYILHEENIVGVIPA